MRKFGKYISGLVCCMLFLSFFLSIPAQAAYNIGFKNHLIEITSPLQNNLSLTGSLTVTGSSALPQVWFCTRGPKNELAAYKAEVQEGRFSINIPLRFGPGEYTIWAGDNARRFDGSIRFSVKNGNSADARYTAPSNYVDSNDERIRALAMELNLNDLDVRSKVQVIHDWIAANIEYDCEAYFTGQNRLSSATEVLEQRKGLCRDFAFLFAALSRHCGVPCKVVYGQAWDDKTASSSLHAWNEVLIDDKWECVDVTWDAGYIEGQRFVRAPSDRYLILDRNVFALSHTPTLVTAH